jgi:hypothetical protein
MATTLSKGGSAQGMIAIVNRALPIKTLRDPHQLDEFMLVKPVPWKLFHGQIDWRDSAMLEVPDFQDIDCRDEGLLENDSCSFLPTLPESLRDRGARYLSAPEDATGLATYAVVNTNLSVDLYSTPSEPTADARAVLRRAFFKTADPMPIVNRHQELPELADLEQPSQLSDLAAISAARDRLALVARSYERRDQEARLEQLREASSRHARAEPRELLSALAVERGLSWHTLGSMLNVTPSAIRKWRRGGSLTPENREQLSALVAFFDMLEDIREPIADLGSWIEMRIREDTTLTPAAMYAMGPTQRWLLLEWARGYIDTAMMLDRFDERWRVIYGRDPSFVVGEGPGGERAILPR